MGCKKYSDELKREVLGIVARRQLKALIEARYPYLKQEGDHG